MKKFCLIWQDPFLYRGKLAFLLSLLPFVFGFFYNWWFYKNAFYFFSFFIVAPQIFAFYIFSGVFLSCLLTPVLEKFFIFLLKNLSLKYQYFFCIFFLIIDAIINKVFSYFMFLYFFFMFLFSWIFIQLNTVFLLPDDTLHYPLFTFKELSILVNENYFFFLGMSDSWTFEDNVFLFGFLIFLVFIMGLLCCVLQINFWRFESISKNQYDRKRFYYEGETFYYNRAALLVERKLAGVVKKYRFLYFYYFCLVCEWLLIFFFFCFFFCLFTAYLQFNFLMVIANFFNTILLTWLLIFFFILWFSFFLFIFFPLLYYFILSYRLGFRIFFKDLELAKKNKYIKP